MEPKPGRDDAEPDPPKVSINLGDGARAGSVIGANYGAVYVHEAAPAPTVAAVFLPAVSAAPAAEAALEIRWRAGEEGWLGDRRYLLIGDKSSLLRDGRDARGQAWRQALARQTDPEPAQGQAYAWLRQGDRSLTREHDLLGRLRPAAADGARRQQASQQQANGARRRHMGRMQAGFPGITHYEAAPVAVTLALSWPTGRDGLPAQTLGERFPPGSLYALQVSRLLVGLRGLAVTLERLHRNGVAHRNLSPESIIAADNGQLALRDLGLAAVGFRQGEGPASYQAPEQAFGARLPQPGPATDVYQLAAVTYHLITGRYPGRNPAPARHEGLPSAAVDIISAALAASPAGRPSMRDFRRALAAPRPTPSAGT